MFFTAFLYYPFEYAFFARVRGRRFPLMECFMILTAPTRYKIFSRKRKGREYY